MLENSDRKNNSFWYHFLKYFNTLSLTFFNLAQRQHTWILINCEIKGNLSIKFRGILCSIIFQINFNNENATQWKVQKQERENVSILVVSNKCATWIMVL